MKEKKLDGKVVLTVETLPDGRFAVNLNGALLTECRSYVDVEDFIEQWEVSAKTFRHGYEIRRQPIPAVRKRKSPRSTAAGKLLEDDALAAESYLTTSIHSLLNNHGWTEQQVRTLCEYVLIENYSAIQERRELPPVRTARRQSSGWLRLFK